VHFYVIRCCLVELRLRGINSVRTLDSSVHNLRRPCGLLAGSQRQRGGRSRGGTSVCLIWCKIGPLHVLGLVDFAGVFRGFLLAFRTETVAG